MKIRHVNVRTDDHPRTFSSPAIHVIQDRDTLSETYGESFAREIDLGKWFLVGVHRGLCKSGGYSVKIRDVKRSSDTIDVTVQFSDPAPGDIVTLVMTEPYDIVFVSREGISPGEEIHFCFRDQDGKEIGRRTVTVSKPGG